MPLTSRLLALARRHRAAVDVLVAAAVVVLTLVSLWSAPGRLPYDAREPDLLSVSLAVLAGAVVAVRRYLPVPALGLALVGALLPLQLGYAAAFAGVAPLLVLWTLAVHRPPHVAALSTATVGAGVALVLNIGPWTATAVEWLGNMLVLLTVVGLGRSVARRREHARGLEERNRALLEAYRARDAALEADERARVAREIQDLVTHGLTAITVQAAAARRLLRADPDTAEQLLAEVEQSGRTATEEMRTVLAVLSPDEAPARRPQPDLSELDELVARARGDGLQVELSSTGEPRPVDAGIALTAYRVVEDALMAARDQSDCCRVRVALGWRGDVLDVAVEEEGLVLAAGTGTGARGRLLRERVRAYGGRLRTDARASGGLAVHATFPTRRSAT